MEESCTTPTMNCNNDDDGDDDIGRVLRESVCM